MKKILIVFCVILFASCTGVETSIFTDNNTRNTVTREFDHQFVVGKIKKLDNNNCLYVDSEPNNWMGEAWTTSKASFVAKKGLFQIGDTVTVCKFTKK